MSLPASKIATIQSDTKSQIEKELAINRTRLDEKNTEFEKEKDLLFSLEDKYIRNEVDPETYKRWHIIYKDKIVNLEFSINRLEKTDPEAFSILDKRLELMADVKYIYHKSDTLEKREFIDLFFDSNLYYENGIYRTPTMLTMLTHNYLKIRSLDAI